MNSTGSGLLPGWAGGRLGWWWCVFAALFVFRLLFAWWVAGDAGVAGDEAYYWDWGRQPAWGYYSKPPLIGWLMALVSLIDGGTVLSIRLAAVLLGTLSLLVLIVLCNRLFGPVAALVTALLVVLSPANMALNLFLTIDAPLILWWSLALLLAWTAVENPGKLGAWLALGAVCALGVWTKQMMLVFPVLLIAWLAVEPAARRVLKTPAPWISLALAFGALAPVLWWNSQNDWITVEHTKHHFNADAEGWGRRAADFGQFFLQQALMYTPVTWGLGVLLICRWFAGWPGLGRRERFLGVFSVAPLPVFGLLALRQEVNPNWPAVFYIGLMVLLGGWLTRAAESLGKAPRPVWTRRALWCGLCFAALSYLWPVAVSLAGWQGAKRLDPMAALRGWREAGAQAGAFLTDCPRPDETFVVVLGHRYNAAQMSFHMPQRPRVYRWERDGRVMSQYEVWPSAADKTGWDALVIYPDPDTGRPRSPLSTHFTRYFESSEFLGEIRTGEGTGRPYCAQVVLCKSMKQWPPPVPAPRDAAAQAP
jgi:4-amino-4-deoxy-L-arabinose transferase-like glycosyltransferase